MINEQSTANVGFNGSSKAYRRDWTGAESVAIAVVEAVAEAKEVDTLDVGPLHDAVDPDALDAIFSATDPARTDVQVTFRFEGIDVTVYGTGEVVARPASEASE